MPEIRKIAKRIVQGDWRKYLQNSLCNRTVDDWYYEEIVLQGIIIGMAKDITIQETLKYLDEFVPKINNWATCDMVCSCMKKTNKYKKQIWDYLEKYINSEKEFELRFVIVMYMDYFLDEDYLELVFDKINNIESEQYYVQMAIAWLISVAYVKQPESTMNFLENTLIDDITYNKALQKIIESNRVTNESKKIIRNMKRKKMENNS